MLAHSTIRKERDRGYYLFLISCLAVSFRWCFQCRRLLLDQVLQPGGRAPGSVGEDSRGSGWGDGVMKRDSAKEFVSGGWEGAGDCNELGSGRSWRGLLDVGTRLKGEAKTGNGLGGE